jgi:hypothetical protein
MKLQAINIALGQDKPSFRTSLAAAWPPKLHQLADTARPLPT